MSFAAAFYSGLKNCLIEDVPGDLVSPIIHPSDRGQWIPPWDHQQQLPD